MTASSTTRSTAPRRRAATRESGSAERTREELLRAARLLFSRKAYSATTVKEIADEAGVNISLVSYHFDGKEGLFKACLHSFASSRREIAARTLQAPSDTAAFRAALMEFFDEMVGLFLAEKEMTLIIHCDLDIEVPAVEETFRETMLPIFQTVVGFITQAQHNGVIVRDKDPTIIAGLFFGSMVHAMRSNPIAEKFLNRSLGDAEYRKQVKTTLVDIFCEGLLSHS